MSVMPKGMNELKLERLPLFIASAICKPAACVLMM